MEPGEGAIRLLLVRHGETIWNAESRLIGLTDLPLSEGGSQQAAQLTARLAGEGIDSIYASDLQRAAQTAAAIGDGCGVRPQADPRLREMDFGEWEGLTFPDLERQFHRRLRLQHTAGQCARLGLVALHSPQSADRYGRHQQPGHPGRGCPFCLDPTRRTAGRFGGGRYGADRAGLGHSHGARSATRPEVRGASAASARR